MVESKQIKVDNWGIFFLQRLQQFYKKSTHCDLTLLFDDHVKIRVHRLVLNACTEYFQVLEKTCPVDNDCLRMPSNLPSDIVIPIINFMYSGILDLNESSFERLYSTAKLMNMSVLTKLLDAQKVPMKPLPQKRLHATPISWHTPVKKIIKPTTFIDELPETLPGRKLPIWKRKSLPMSPYMGQITSSYESFTPKKVVTDEPPKPTRFDWPESDDNSFDNAFDDISYESKPLILPTFTEKLEKSPKAGPSSTFEEIKKTAGPIKRSASPLGNQSKKVNLQDVKEYLKEHKIRSDYINYEDEEAPDNDLQTFDNDESLEETSQNIDDTPNKSILKNEGGGTPSNKHVRFSLEDEDKKDKHVRFSLEGDDVDKKTVKSTPKGGNTPKSDQDMSKHTKIIAEVLKKYPHLVKNNKNIRLKIMAKGPQGNSGTPKIIKTPPINKTATKVSYMVVKPDEKQGKPQGKEIETHVCTKCEKPQTFESYHIYKQHLTQVHNEKEDSQMCMICGHVSRKQNLLVYHKFVKHNIVPPTMYNFPKCKECSYIALSPVVLQKHMATHAATDPLQHYTCGLCDKKFVSETIFNTHMERNHPTQIKQEESEQKPKEKIKILSDVKVINTNQYQTKEIKTEVATEPSSEAEALSNVASGIAASLGLVDTIVVLDENQFILQSQAGNLQQNIITNSDGSQEYIIPEMQLNNIATTTDQNQQGSNVLTQTIKTGITSTDELVMVLTDHDYGDGNNAVITDNNIVVLYSHPVQTQAGTMMLTSEGNMIEVDKNYAQNIPVTIAGSCEESIEMIQQEINNQLDTSQEVTLVSEGQSANFIQTQIQKPPLITVQSNIRVNPPEIKMENVEVQNYEGTVLNTEKLDTVQTTQTYEVLNTETGVLSSGRVLNVETGVLNPQTGILHSETGVLQTQNGQNMTQIIEIDSNVQICDQNQTLNVEKGPHFEENEGQIVYVAPNDDNISQIQQEIQMEQQIIDESESIDQNVDIGQENGTLIQENPELVQDNSGLVQEDSGLVQEDSVLIQEESGLVQEESGLTQEESNSAQENLNLGQENSNLVSEHSGLLQENSNLIQNSSIAEEGSNLIQDSGLTQENSTLIQENVDLVEENVSEIQESGIITQNPPQTETNAIQYEENITQFEENAPIEETMEQVAENITQIDPNLTETQQDSQNEEYMSQIESQNEEIISQEDPNMIQTEETLPQTQENTEEPMEIDQTQQAPISIEENITQSQQFENSQIEDQGQENQPQTEETEFGTQEIPENIPSIQNEEQEPIETSSTEVNISNQIQNEEMDQSQEEIIQEDQNPNDLQENVPYEERLPIDASMEQIGDIPQNEENGTQHGDHYDNVNNDVIEETTNVENQPENTQIDVNQPEVDDTKIEDLNLEKMETDILETSDDRCENKMAANDEQVQTSLTDEINEDNDENVDNSQKLESSNKEKPVQGKHDRIMKILDDWDDGESDSQQSFSKSQQNNETSEEKIENSESIKKLIDDWEEEEDT